MKRFDRLAILWIAFILAVLGNLAMPFVLYFLLDNGRFYFALLLISSLVAEMGLLGIWCALANQKMLIRVPVATGLLILGGVLHNLSMRLAAEYYRAEQAAMIFFIVLILFIGMQLPLWFVRYGLHRRIGLQGETRAERNSGKFSIRYLLVATAAVAVLLALFQAMVPEGELSGNLSFMLLYLIGGAGVFAIFAASLCLPAVWLVLSESDASRTSAAIAMFVAWLAGPIVLLVILVAMTGGGGGMTEIPPTFYIFGLGAGGTTLLGLYLLRRLGYRLLIVDREGNLRVEGKESIAPGKIEPCEELSPSDQAMIDP